MFVFTPGPYIRLLVILSYKSPHIHPPKQSITTSKPLTIITILLVTILFFAIFSGVIDLFNFILQIRRKKQARRRWQGKERALPEVERKCSGVIGGGELDEGKDDDNSEKKKGLGKQDNWYTGV